MPLITLLTFLFRFIILESFIASMILNYSYIALRVMTVNKMQKRVNF